MLKNTSLLLTDGRQSEQALFIRRGVGRFLAQHDFVFLPEMTLPGGRRADMMALNGKGLLWIVEIKSSVADFRADHKWRDYCQHCDRFSFATSPNVPVDIFPEEAGLIVADGFGAELIRQAPDTKLSPAKRKSLTLAFARTSAMQLAQAYDGGLHELSVT